MVNDRPNKEPDAADPHPVPKVREAHDAEHHDELKHDPSDEEAIADIALDESFPASDPPSHTSPGGGEPAPSSGYDEQAERDKESMVLREKSPLEDPGAPGGTAGAGGTRNEQDN